MGEPGEVTDSLQRLFEDEILRLYQEVAENPRSEFHFSPGREAAELFEYDPAWPDRAPPGAVDLPDACVDAAASPVSRLASAALHGKESCAAGNLLGGLRTG